MLLLFGTAGQDMIIMNQHFILSFKLQMDIQNLNIHFYILHKNGHIHSNYKRRTKKVNCDRESNSKNKWEKENERNQI